MSFSSSRCSRSSNPGRDQYKAFMNVCKFKYLDYNCKNDKAFPHASLSRGIFITLIQEKNIKLPSFDDFKAGKTIHYDANGFSTSNRLNDLNSTMLFASTSDPLEQLQVKKEAVERFQQVKNNFENNKTISRDSSIDVTLIQAFENEISFDLPGFVVPVHNSSTPPRQEVKDKSILSLMEKSELEQSTLDLMENSSDASIICVRNNSFDALGLNKTVNVEDLNWHITKISDWRSQGGKNQYKVHYKKVNKKSFRP